MRPESQGFEGGVLAFVEESAFGYQFDLRDRPDRKKPLSRAIVNYMLWQTFVSSDAVKMHTKLL